MSERNVIELEIGKPQLLTLEFDSPLEGENRNGAYFGYKCNAGEDILFVPEAGKVAIDRIGARKGDTIALTKAKNGNRNIWTAEHAKQEPARSQAAARPRPPASEPQQHWENEPQATTPQRARKPLAAAETPSQSWPLAEQLMPLLRAAIIACSQAQKEAQQNGAAQLAEFDTKDVCSLAITLYIQHQKGGR